MSLPAAENQDLRNLMRDRLPAASTEACPDPDLYWRAWAREIPQGEIDRLIEHTVGCADCAAASRLARELAPLAGAGKRRTASGSRNILRTLALAASLGGVAITLWFARDRLLAPRESQMRSGNSVVVRSLVSEEVALSRARCELSWSAVPEASHYRITVTDESLRLLVEQSFLKEASFVVPESALASVPRGGKIIWQVEASLPEGSSIRSETFFQSVE